MNSSTVKSYWQLFYALPEAVRIQARKAFVVFQHDPFDPRLQFKEIRSRKGWWSARIDGDFRVLGMAAGRYDYLVLDRHARRLSETYWQKMTDAREAHQ